MRDLRGANAVLTGGSRGLGPHIARALAGAGVNIALAARDQARLLAVQEELRAHDVRTITVETDVCSADDRARLVERATSELGAIDVLINNAGIEPTGEFARLDPAIIESAIATNLTSCALLMRAVLPGMIERGRGHVVNIASLAGKVPIPYDSVYSATKFGLVSLSHAVRGELRGTGVGISAVCPGFVSDAGMYADAAAETGVSAPAIAGTSKPEQVVKAVLRAIQHNVAEVIVAPLSGRPLVSIAGIAPNVGQLMMRQTGVVEMFRQVAVRRAGED
ncbi:MAG: SDR family NAD(P)-dependent oxidoreductase [Dehalococcoidia bacterium]